jgi:hypothetical protein
LQEQGGQQPCGEHEADFSHPIGAVAMASN